MEEKEVKTIIEEILQKLEVEGSIEVTTQEDNVEVVLDTPDTGIVIGYHGEILESLQLVLSMALTKKAGKFIRVSLEVGDYKKNRTGWLEHLATQAKEQALREQKAVSLPSLKSWERRIVHVYLQSDDEVVSESVGEGRERTLVVKPRE